MVNMESIKISPALAAAANNAMGRPGKENVTAVAVIVAGVSGYMVGNTFFASGNELIAMTLKEAEEQKIEPLTLHFATATPGHTPEPEFAAPPPPPPVVPAPDRDNVVVGCPRNANDMRQGQFPQYFPVCTPLGELLSRPAIHRNARHEDRQIRGYTNKIIRLSTTSAHGIVIHKSDADRMMKNKNLREDERIPFWSSLLARFGQGEDVLDLDLFRITPADTEEEWFAKLTTLLLDGTCNMYWWNSHDSVRDFLHRMDPRMGKKKSVHMITIVFLVQRLSNSVRAATTVLSYAPQIITNEMRRHALGDLLGTRFTKKLLHCVLHRTYDLYLAAERYLLQAAADLLTAHLKRSDHIQLAKQGDGSGQLFNKFQSLFDFLDISAMRESRQNVADQQKKMIILIARKTGIIYGATMNYMVDTAREQAWNSAITQSIINGIGGVLAAAIHWAPIPSGAADTGGAVITGIANVTAAVVDESLKQSTTLTREISNLGKNFQLNIVQNAQKGIITAKELEALALDEAVKQDLDLVKIYATIATETLDAVTNTDEIKISMT